MTCIRRKMRKRHMPTLCKPAVFVPEYVITREETLDLCKTIHANHPQLPLALRLLRNTGVLKRHLIQPIEEVLKHPGFEKRNSIYEEQSKRLTPPKVAIHSLCSLSWQSLLACDSTRPSSIS